MTYTWEGKCDRVAVLKGTCPGKPHYICAFAKPTDSWEQVIANCLAAEITQRISEELKLPVLVKLDGPQTLFWIENEWPILSEGASTSESVPQADQAQ